ncbi:hypothetical protein [Streptomyces sp. BA2]|uniref:hypothetical protein n=1 Tax=Streptomyces sp. BA2 TaxID=436595 RepID=UPI0013229322|nr:hypothetical protein [Streptomyces sp. BA2]MWA07825.1 hypothetical protein [Streptomyces sp. BA2]
MTRSSIPRPRLAACAVTAALLLTLSPTAAAVDEPTEPGELKLIATPSGTALADRDGNPLYSQAADKANTSRCVGECATNWPAATGYPTKGAGVDGVTGFTSYNPEGADKPQVIYNGHLLYYYKGDQPNEPKGQAVGGWSLLGADGKTLKNAERDATHRTDITQPPGATSSGPVRGGVEHLSATTEDSEVRPLGIGAVLLVTAAGGVWALLRLRRGQDTSAGSASDAKEGER